MRLLILTPRLPWPPTDGGRVAMSRLATSLAACGAEVEILSLNPRKHHGVAEGPLPIQAIDIDTSRVVVPPLHVPYVVARFISPEFREALVATIARFKPDVVQIESPFLLPYASECKSITVLRSLNVEFRIWEGLARNERNPVRRVAMRRIASSLKRYELREMNKLDAIVPISDDDARDFRALGITKPMHVTPCSTDTPVCAPVPPIPNAVGFIGSLDFRPNQEAVKWIADELWPRVIARLPEARLSIAGSAPPDWLQRKPIDLRGNVGDAQAFMCQMSVIIAPLFAGGGMRIKVLEAMALGKPVVATTLGAGGITHDGDVVIADDVDSFADAVVRLLRDPAEAARIGAAARANVARRYDGETLARGLLTFYRTL
jgi:glycosyltransferase involved in cell wall biosynthesis